MEGGSIIHSKDSTIWRSIGLYREPCSCTRYMSTYIRIHLQAYRCGHDLSHALGHSVKLVSQKKKKNMRKNNFKKYIMKLS